MTTVLLCLAAGLALGLLKGVLDGGPWMWLGFVAAVARFGAEPSEPVGALGVGLAVYVGGSLLWALVTR